MTPRPFIRVRRVRLKPGWKSTYELTQVILNTPQPTNNLYTMFSLTSTQRQRWPIINNIKHCGWMGKCLDHQQLRTGYKLRNKIIYEPIRHWRRIHETSRRSGKIRRSVSVNRCARQHREPSKIGQHYKRHEHRCRRRNCSWIRMIWMIRMPHLSLQMNSSHCLRPDGMARICHPFTRLVSQQKHRYRYLHPTNMWARKAGRKQVIQVYLIWPRTFQHISHQWNRQSTRLLPSVRARNQPNQR